MSIVKDAFLGPVLLTSITAIEQQSYGCDLDIAIRQPIADGLSSLLSMLDAGGYQTTCIWPMVPIEGKVQLCVWVSVEDRTIQLDLSEHSRLFADYGLDIYHEEATTIREGYQILELSEAFRTHLSHAKLSILSSTQDFPTAQRSALRAIHVSLLKIFNPSGHVILHAEVSQEYCDMIASMCLMEMKVLSRGPKLLRMALASILRREPRIVMVVIAHRSLNEIMVSPDMYARKINLQLLQVGAGRGARIVRR